MGSVGLLMGLFQPVQAAEPIRVRLLGRFHMGPGSQWVKTIEPVLTLQLSSSKLSSCSSLASVPMLLHPLKVVACCRCSSSSLMLCFYVHPHRWRPDGWLFRKEKL